MSSPTKKSSLYPTAEGWKDIGKSIWEKIKGGISAAGDWIKGLVLKGEYPAAASWKDVGSKIWESIKKGITVTGDWVKKLVLKEEYKPESSWSEVGKKIIDKILDHKQAKAENISAFMIGLVGKIVGYNGWESLGTQLGTVAKNIIDGIGDHLPAMTDLVVKILGGIQSIFSSEATESMITGFTNFATSIIEGMRERHQQEVNALPIKAAFCMKQFEEAMAEWGLTKEDTDKIYKLGDTGCFYLRSDSQLIHDTFKRHREEREAAIAADTTGEGYIKQMFLYEMANYEYGYTMDLTDTLDALGYTVEQINADKRLAHGLYEAKKKYIDDLE